VGGTHAATIALGMGARVTVVDIDLQRLHYLDEIFGNRLDTLFSDPENIAHAISKADLVIGAVLIPGARAPKLVTRDMVSQMPAGSVIVDVAVDQGGCIETTRATTHDDPTYVIDGVVHYGVANMPGAVPHTSTLALTNTTLRYALKLASEPFKDLMSSDPSLQLGVNTYRGHVTHEVVAQSLDVACTPPEQLP